MVCRPILLVLCPFLFACTMNDTGQVHEGTSPNVVLILTDDQGWGDLSINGNTNLATPNIDKLGKEGAIFDHFYVCPVCSPTRAEILTGRYHLRGGVYDTSEGGERLDLDEVTIAQYFKEAGYKTAGFGKWHNGMQYPYHPNGRGFDEFYGFCSGHWGNYFSPMLEHNGAIVKGEGFIIDDLTDKAISFAEESADHPFFLYLPFNTPHGPMQVPDQWWNKFQSKSLELKHRQPEKEDTLNTKAALAMCENIDWNVGRLNQKLSDLGLLENTIIIFLSDNGPDRFRWNGGMKGKKGDVDEGGVRSPMMIYWKDHIIPGTTISNIASAIDILPTLVDLTGIGTSFRNPIDGINLTPLIMGEQPDSWDRLVYNYWNKKIGVRSQNYLLDKDNNLYDMISDPGQYEVINTHNPEILSSLIEAKEHWKAEVMSELPEKDLRTFPVGHPEFRYTQIPARDGIATGSIRRSNRWPNCSFYTNWVNVEDSIYWDVEVMSAGQFAVDLYYTCPESDLGSRFSISFLENALEGTIDTAHDPPLTGMENDRYPRGNSYVKDFKMKEVGTIDLREGEGRLVLKALEKPGSQVMDFRLLMLRRV